MFFIFQGCTPRKIEGSPILWAYENQGGQHLISMEKLGFYKN